MIWTYQRAGQTLSHPAGAGFEAWSCEAHNDTVPGTPSVPPGTYTLGAAAYRDVADGADPNGDLWLHAEGVYYIPIYGVHSESARGSVGIHGGGSALAKPLAARQGWVPTEECIRVQNDDLFHIAQNVGDQDTLVVI